MPPMAANNLTSKGGHDGPELRHEAFWRWVRRAVVGKRGQHDGGQVEQLPPGMTGRAMRRCGPAPACARSSAPRRTAAGGRGTTGATYSAAGSARRAFAASRGSSPAQAKGAARSSRHHSVLAASEHHQRPGEKERHEDSSGQERDQGHLLAFNDMNSATAPRFDRAIVGPPSEK